MTASIILTILLATVTQFIVGAIWYTPLFGQLWGKIHGFDKLDKKVQKEMMSKMGPIFGVQFAVTLVTSVMLTLFHTALPTFSLYTLTLGIWLGFVAPSQVSGILFGGVEEKWMITKAAIMAGGSLIGLFAGAMVVSLIG